MCGNLHIRKGKAKGGGRHALAAHGEAGLLITHHANGAHLRCKRQS